MLKVCGRSICKHLELIFIIISHVWFKGFFDQNRKRQMSYLYTKKVQTAYISACLYFFPTCSKVFERLIYDTMFSHLLTNNLLSENESDLKPGASCINQILAIRYKIYSSFYENYEVRGVFLDNSKAFGKV